MFWIGQPTRDGGYLLLTHSHASVVRVASSDIVKPCLPGASLSVSNPLNPKPNPQVRTLDPISSGAETSEILKRKPLHSRGYIRFWVSGLAFGAGRFIGFGVGNQIDFEGVLYHTIIVVGIVDPRPTPLVVEEPYGPTAKEP